MQVQQHTCSKQRLIFNIGNNPFSATFENTHLGRQAVTRETDTTITTTTTTINIISKVLGKFAPFHTGGGHRRKPLILNGRGTPTTLRGNPLF